MTPARDVAVAGQAEAAGDPLATVDRLLAELLLLREQLAARPAPARVPQLVTLLQASYLCRRSKKTLERAKGSPGFPPAANPGRRNGQALLYEWAALRPFLADHFGVLLPEHFPTINPLEEGYGDRS